MSSELERIPVAIEEEMKSSFMDYAMSVIIARALPDARDGLKPVHRRILFAQYQASNFWNRPYVKSARIVGDVLGKFHPHGDQSVYDALARMVQDFSMRYPLADGQGNWGSVDGDPPAAMRYTEVRMSRIASEMLQDIDKETVDWSPNYDEKELEPQVLPTRLPNLLVNGSTGIAVGMATNIPPHNLTEVLEGAIAVAQDPALTNRDLMKLVSGPDFPTGGIIYGRRGIVQAYETGRGSVVVRGRATIEEKEKQGRASIVVTEIPYMVNKARWIAAAAELVKDKKLEGISEIRDESDREGMRVVFDLKRDAMPNVVLNHLYKQTALQSSFGVIMLAIVDGRPRVLSLRDAIGHFVEFRREVVTRRTVFELREARSRLEIVEGLGIAVDNIDRVIAIIRAAPDPEAAKAGLMAAPLGGLGEFLRRAGRPEKEIQERLASGDFRLSARQAQAILEMRLQRLTGLEREKLEAEYRELWVSIDRLEAILGDEKLLVGVVVEELQTLKQQYGDKRRTEILDDEGELSMEDMIADEPMVVTVSHEGYVKRNPIGEYRAQKRGGRGVTGASTREEDFVNNLFVARAHDHLLLFTNTGRAYSKRVYELPEGSRASRGKPLVNLLELQSGERVVEMLPLREFAENSFVFMATKNGVVKKTELSAFANIRVTGIIALSIDPGDDLIEARVTDGKAHILLASKGGYAIRFSEEQVRPMGRGARGVRGIALREGDELVAMAVIEAESQATLLTVSERGYGKRTPAGDYPTKNRAGLGVITIKTTERNGQVVGVKVVSDEDDLMLITTAGKVIRMLVQGIPTLGRNTQGVRLVRLAASEKVVAVERLAERDEDEARSAAEVEVEVLEGEEDHGEENGAPEPAPEDVSEGGPDGEEE
ncbi:MAG TPA: DNA gyrase subunit A [Polyangia bacterium]|jgi:DNA gyrase subunit A|nr:DNA gyrase subunit A [Polyangia bacterium]